MAADWTATYADFDHYLYPAEFHQAIAMITGALRVDESEARRWIRHQAGVTRQDLLVVARDIVTRQLPITWNGLGGPGSSVTDGRDALGDHRLGLRGAAR